MVCLPVVALDKKFILMHYKAKPYLSVVIFNTGHSSVGIDLRLHGFSHAYGIPEHADSLQLKDTRYSQI